VPSRDTVSNFKSIEIFLSPNACEGAPDSIVCEAHLLSNGWKLCRMGTVPERSYALKYGIRGRRKQYGLKHQISMTIHTAMGQTLNGVVSKVTSQAVDPTYSLWIASQVVVLLSRTNYARQIVFVG
jgi:hypothetical protein